VSNVFAVIEGSDPALKNRYVVIGAHYDGQGLDRPIHGDSIKNAADDNASGSAAVLAIAEALARGPRPKRSIVLAWFAAEEIGLGAPYHLRHKPDQTLATDLAVILDMVGRPDAGIHTVNGSTSELLDRAMAINRSYLGIELRASPAGEDGGSDDGSYKNHSRPFLLYADDGFLAPGVVEAVADKHTVTDQAEKIDFALLQRLTRTVYVTAWMFANEGLPR
jgi:Zn-dependent M28 family amino/carboxypeptidase